MRKPAFKAQVDTFTANAEVELDPTNLLDAETLL